MSGVAFVDRLPARLAMAGVLGYRQYLSPRKGFSCPHRLLEGGESCSAFAMRLLRRGGLLRARLLMKRRFARCRQARKLLRRRILLSAAVVPVVTVIMQTADEHFRRLNRGEKERRQVNADCLPCDCWPFGGAVDAGAEAAGSAGSFCSNGIHVDAPECSPGCIPDCDCSP